MGGQVPTLYSGTAIGDYMIQKPPTAQNYSFGHIGLGAVVFNAIYQDYSKPRGHVESMDMHVAPRSLYLTQLKERLGMEAVNNVTHEEQGSNHPGPDNILIFKYFDFHKFPINVRHIDLS